MQSQVRISSTILQILPILEDQTLYILFVRSQTSESFSSHSSATSAFSSPLSAPGSSHRLQLSRQPLLSVKRHPGNTTSLLQAVVSTPNTVISSSTSPPPIMMPQTRTRGQKRRYEEDTGNQAQLQSPLKPPTRAPKSLKSPPQLRPGNTPWTDDWNIEGLNPALPDGGFPWDSSDVPPLDLGEPEDGLTVFERVKLNQGAKKKEDEKEKKRRRQRMGGIGSQKRRWHYNHGKRKAKNGGGRGKCQAKG